MEIIMNLVTKIQFRRRNRNNAKMLKQCEKALEILNEMCEELKKQQ